jgi:polyisoprenoid-binding protein YceI
MRKALDAEHYPTMRFTVEAVESSFPSVTDKADVLLTIRGQLLIRDVERPLTLLGRARLRDGAVWVRGDGTLKMSGSASRRPSACWRASPISSSSGSI